MTGAINFKKLGQVQRTRFEVTTSATDSSIVAAGIECVLDGIEVLPSSTSTSTINLIIEDQSDNVLSVPQIKVGNAQITREGPYFGAYGVRSSDGLQFTTTLSGRIDFNVCYRVIE